jgi:hypothetical protein
MSTIQAIHYTPMPEAWHALAQALGLRPTSALAHVWSEFDGDGVLAIHGMDAGTPERTDIHVLVDDLDATVRCVQEAGFDVERTRLDDVGPMIVIRPRSGIVVTASAGERHTEGALSVQPIWYARDAAEPVALFTALGLDPLIRSDSGDWVGYRASDGGRVAFHRGEIRTELSFEYAGDLDSLAVRVVDAGFETAVVDEAYNRTLLVTTPAGERLWVNGVMDDLYGYSRAQ